MTLQLLRSELPYIRGKFDFFFISVALTETSELLRILSALRRTPLSCSAP
jgi:hypothetical protein